MLIDIKSDPLYQVSLNGLTKIQAQKLSKAFTVIKALRKAGANNVMYCLSFRAAATSPKDKAAVEKVGVAKVKEAFDFIAREFAK
jgi:hypothetical protein